MNHANYEGISLNNKLKVFHLHHSNFFLSFDLVIQAKFALILNKLQQNLNANGLNRTFDKIFPPRNFARLWLASSVLPFQPLIVPYGERCSTLKPHIQDALFAQNVEELWYLCLNKIYIRTKDVYFPPTYEFAMIFIRWMSENIQMIAMQYVLYHS